MLNRRHYYAAAIALFALAVSAAQPLRGRTQSGAASGREQDWREIMRLWEEGKPLITKGLADSYKDRQVWVRQVEIFNQAAPKLDSWIGRNISDRNSLDYLKNVYRLGNYWEYAGNWPKAHASYKICSEHPLLDAPGATYGGKPLRQLVNERLAQTAKALKKNDFSRPGYVFVQTSTSQGMNEKPDSDSVFPPQPLDEPLD